MLKETKPYVVHAIVKNSSETITPNIHIKTIIIEAHEIDCCINKAYGIKSPFTADHRDGERTTVGAEIYKSRNKIRQRTKLKPQHT